MSGENRWLTRPRRLGERLPTSGVSPSLLYHKWHAYDLTGGEKDRKGRSKDRSEPPKLTFDTKGSRVEFLQDVAKRVGVIVAGEEYKEWQEGYLRGLRALGGTLVPWEATTLWRFVAGFGSNPALETGLHLHPLYGFPYLPGSAVKGLVHHVAEMRLMEKPGPGVEDSETLPGEEHVERFVEGAEKVKKLLGSLTLQQGREEGRDGEKRLVGPETPRTWLERWKKRDELGEELKSRMVALLEHPTGGCVSFYDAVPLPASEQEGQGSVVEPDVLNPHYPDYYSSEGKTPPSDDQNPNPVYFLAVKPGVSFVFPYRVWRRADGESGIQRAVDRWLRQGFADIGAGGKTAAGYGYFNMTERQLDEARRGGRLKKIDQWTLEPRYNQTEL